MRYLLLLALLIGVPCTVQAATLISEDYEVADVDSLAGRGWLVDNTTDIDSNPVLAIVPCPSGRSGNCLRMQYAGVHVDDCCNAKITRSFTSSPDIWERYYLRNDKIIAGDASGFTSVTAKQHYYNNSTLPDFVTDFLFGSDEMGLVNQTTTSHTCPNGSTDTTCNMDPNVMTAHYTYGTWRCIETHASQTSIDIYVDGNNTLHYTNPQWISPSNWDTIAVYRQGSDNQYRYEDDFVIATTRVGCAGGGEEPPPVIGTKRFAPMLNIRR